MIRINHTACGRPAFIYEHMPVSGEKILRKYARHIDGRKYMGFEGLIACASCGKALRAGKRLEPGEPVLRTLDMSNTEDMQEFYDTKD